MKSIILKTAKDLVESSSNSSVDTSFLQYVPDRLHKSIRKSIGFIEDGIKNDSIPNAQFTTAKRDIGRAISYANDLKGNSYIEYMSLLRDGGNDTRNDDLKELEDQYYYAGIDNVGSFERGMKLLNKVKSQASKISGSEEFIKLVNDSIEVFESFADVHEKLMSLKDKTVKRGSNQDKAKTSKDTPYNAPLASKESVEKVRKVTREAILHEWEYIKKREKEILEGVIEKYFKDRKDEFQSPYALWGGHKTTQWHLNIAVRFIKQDRDIEKHSYGKQPYVRIPNFDQAIDAQAKKYADNACAKFESKQMSKLSSIIEKKDNLSKVEIVSIRTDKGALEGTIRLEFEDGSSFNAKSSIVYVFNQGGMPFYRFPTTFHDVVFSDGTKRKMVKEEDMNTEFAKS